MSYLRRRSDKTEWLDKAVKRAEQSHRKVEESDQTDISVREREAKTVFKTSAFDRLSVQSPRF